MGTLTVRGSTSGQVQLSVPATVSPNITYVLPGTDGQLNQAIVTDGAGNLSFAFVTSGAHGNAAYNQANTTQASLDSLSVYSSFSFANANGAFAKANAAFIQANTADDYTAANLSTSLWATSPPLTVQAAIERLANAVIVLRGYSPIP